MDLLLGVEEVLLLPGTRVVSDSVATSASLATPPTAHAPQQRARGFEAALFGASPGSSSAASAPRINVSAVNVATSSDTPRNEFVRERVRTSESGASVAALNVSPVIALIESVPISNDPDRRRQLAALEELHAATCTQCKSAASRARLVFGEGDVNAQLVFIGEAPSESDEDAGRPFTGASGQKLDEMISAMGFARSEVYLAHALKCCPPGDQAPTPEALAACAPFLLAQLLIIRPTAIVTLGGAVSKLLLASPLGITRLRGTFAQLQLGQSSAAPLTVAVMPTYHPSYLLRNYTPQTRGEMWGDLKQVLQMLGREIPTKKS